MNLFMEMVGYLGTALVIVSMLMTSVTKLRVINICGALLALIYGVFTATWPNVLLNGTLILINVAQLVRSYRLSNKEEKNEA